MKVLLAVLSVLAVATAAPHRSPIKPRLDTRIIGGQAVDISEFPFQLSFLYFNSHICGAVIISETFSVTAAHCTDGSSVGALSVRAGSNLHNSGGVVIPLTAFFQHPDYDWWLIDFDITVLQLSSSLSLGVTIAPVTLPYDGQDWAGGTNSTVSGWGTLVQGGSLSPNLQAVSVPIVTLAECRAAYGANDVTERMICAGLPQGGQDACQGDSGGPLVVGSEPILAGLVSWGYGCAQPNFPGVYSHVGALRSFITLITGI